MFNIASFWVGVNVGITIAATIYTISILYMLHRYETLERKTMMMENKK